MTTLTFDHKKHAWNPDQATFTVSERDVPFDTSYLLKNPKTDGTMKFDFEKSTGPEFDPATKWIYWNLEKNVKLEVCNDPEMTRTAAQRYLAAKLKK
jgi:hypothetical protein